MSVNNSALPSEYNLTLTLSQMMTLASLCRISKHAERFVGDPTDEAIEEMLRLTKEVFATTVTRECGEPGR